jgi:hypothetical protein
MPFLAMAASVTDGPVAAPITHLVTVKVIEGPVSMLRDWTAIAVTWIEAAVHLAMEVAGTMEPRAGSDKDTAAEPLRPVVPVRGTAIRRIVEITIRAYRRYPDIDGDPCRCTTWDTQHGDGQDNECR